MIWSYGQVPKRQSTHWFKFIYKYEYHLMDIHKMKLNRDWSQEIPNIRSMGIEGITLDEISIHYGVSRTYIRTLIKKYGIFDDGVPYSANAKAVIKQNAEKNRLQLRYGINDGSELYKAKRAKFIIKKSNMKRAGKEFTINFGELDWPEYCPVLGIKLDYFAEGKPNDNSPSFDRVDNNKGYVKDNVQIISYKANRIKNDVLINELKLILEYMENHGL